MIAGDFVVRSVDTLDALPSEARALMDQSESQSLYLGSDWWHLFEHHVARPMGAVCRYFWVERLNKPSSAERSGALSAALEITAVLPVMQAPHLKIGEDWWGWFKGMIKRSLRGAPWQSMSNYYTGLYQPILRHPQASGDLLLLMRELHAQQKIRHLSLQPLCEESANLLQGLLENAGFKARRRSAHANWFQPVEPGPEGFERYWAARPSRLRNTIKRAHKRFMQAGGRIEIVDGQDAAGLERAIQVYAQVYAHSWKPQEALPGFLPGFIKLAARRGWLRLGIAWLGTEPVAVHLWLVVLAQAGNRTQKKAEIFKLAYDQRAARYSAGSLLGQALAKHVITADQVEELDYLTGDDEYKSLWMNGRRERFQLSVAA